MYLELKAAVLDWQGDFLSGHEQRRRLIASFEGKVPDGRLVGREADYHLRQGLVRASSDHPLAMAYGSAPPITFRPAKGAIHMVAFGREASEVLETHAPAIKRALANQVGRLAKSSLESGDLIARPAENLVMYNCGRMAVKKLDRKGQHQIGQMYTLKDVDLQIRRSIAGGVVSRCEALRDDAPDLSGAIPYGLEDQVVIIGGDVMIGRPGGAEGPLCVVVDRLKFALPMILQGYWEGGHYRSYGYGTFVRAWPPAIGEARSPNHGRSQRRPSHGGGEVSQAS